MAVTTSMQVALDEDDVPRLLGHVGARADGDAHVGLGQRGGVVDAVAHHGHELARVLQLLDLLGLVLRQHLGQHLVDAHLPGDGLGRPPVVAGDHHRTQAHAVQPGDGCRGRVLEHVGDRHDAGRVAVDGDEHGGLALGGQFGSDAS